MLEESVITKAPAKKVWQAWSDMYRWNQGMKSGKKGYVMKQTGHKVPFYIVDVKKGEEFTTIWKSFLVKMYFRYMVSPKSKGSLIRCRVKFGGAMGWAAQFFLRSKVKKNLSETLYRFAEQLDLGEKKKKVMRRF